MSDSANKLISSLAIPILRKVNKFKNIHKGESCYLMGDGASVKWFDLRVFDDKISIPVGYIPFHNDFRELNAKYCLLIEPFWFYPLVQTYHPPIRKIRNHVQERYREVIKSNREVDFFINLSNYPVVWDKNVSYLFRDIPGSNLIQYFLSKGINPFHGSLRTSILMAIHFGFDHAYLIGYDYTHTPSRILHWYEKGEGLIKDHYGYEKEFFDIAREFINLTTVTIEGGSDKLNYISYKDLTGQEPSFKENTDIINIRYLKSLSTWHNYEIF